jgi:phage FluMu protein Com
MAKIKFSKWKESVQFEKLAFGYKIEGLEWWRTTSQHGRSQGEVKCPCCDAMTNIYIWSFRGSGKRCSNCNVMLGSMGAFVDVSEITKDVSINHTHIFKSASSGNGA